MGYNISILKLLYHGIMIIWVRCNQHKIYIYNIANQHTTNTLIYIYNQRTIEYDEPYFTIRTTSHKEYTYLYGDDTN